uniref:Reverse transcriptase domain-containing protein n=1 Tax=Fagus sylvatica TaxID=28930 RepID=A0A2N9ENM7_FAGSY
MLLKHLNQIKDLGSPKQRKLRSIYPQSLMNFSKKMKLSFPLKDGNGAVWVGFRPAPPRPDPFRYPPQKTRLLPRPACLTGTRLTRPDGRWIGSDQTTIIGHLNPTCCRSAESKQDLSHRRSVRTDPVRGFCCAPFFRPDLIHASAANPRRERCYAVDGGAGRVPVGHGFLAIPIPADLHNLITPNISVEDNDDLCKIPSTEEINAALFGMSSLKAPSSDGLPVPIPTTANNYRPISLCNVVYKIIAKLLVDKLRPFLQRLISHCQSAFIPSRWIAENEVIVQELLHSFKQRKVKVGVMAVKLDLQKAYDRLNWPFLQVVLNKFGFDDRFIKWIMECVSSVSHTILVNGGKTDQIFPSRGVRQGVPLSPYLFIMCQDVLSRMLDRGISAGRLSGQTAEATILTEWLEKYCSWSGQLINRNKSGVFFSKHTKKPMQRSLKCLLQMKVIQKDSFYLGSPMFLRAAKTKDFHFLLDKVEFKLKGWRSKSLSWARRTTLIKSVAQALPTYTMSTFEVPTTIWTKIDSATRRFWWNLKTSSGSHLALKSWEALCLPHKQGGLGFRKRKEFKMALVSKMAWMVITNRHNSCMDLLRSACFQVGDGKSINVWKDPWIPWLTGFKPKPKNQSISLNPLMVSSLINFNTKSWKTDQLIELFDEESILAIQKITIPIRSFIDKHLSHQISLHMALTLETIWSLRNQMIHNGDQVKLLSIIKNLDARVLEHMESLKASSQEQGDALNLNYQQNLSASVIPMQQGTTTWIPPAIGVIKLNVDAAISKDFSTLAVVARNANGEIIKAWAKVHFASNALQAEAAAILWALELTNSEKFPCIIVEGDSKICCYALNNRDSEAAWREANEVAHAMAKFASQSKTYFNCNMSSLPKPV